MQGLFLHIRYRLKLPLLLFVMAMLMVCSLSAQNKDTATLKNVTITGSKTKNVFTAVTPVQLLNKEALQQMNAGSVGDAAKYFSGVLVKDYGGVGGLKTISVRSLGAAHTGILYDGIPVSDVQSGQVDLSKFSGSFVQSLELQQASISNALVPARVHASGSALAITTNTFRATNFQQINWQAGLKAGSFGFWQPLAGIYMPLKKNIIVSANAEAVFSKGNYPFFIENGNLSENSKRSNAAVASYQGEINVIKQFTDSATLQTKVWGYQSERGLPGAIVFFNDRSVQKLWNTEVFVQSRYAKNISEATSLLISAKYNFGNTKYTDPDFLNNQGGLNNKYKQHEWYGSIAASHKVTEGLVLSAATDAAWTKLTANLSNFSYPSRLSNWNCIGLYYSNLILQASGSLLHTFINDNIKNGIAASNKNKFTPSIAISLKPNAESPFMLRAFYKHVFRMPTFNDLYYTLIGNNSLKPEYATQYNIGISYSKRFNGVFRQFSMSADGYFNHIKDKIIAVPSRNLFVWTMLNLGKVYTKGLDVNLETNGRFTTLITWNIRAAYTWQQALDVTNKTSATYKNRIPYTPDHSGSGLASVAYKQWRVGYNYLFSGSRYTLGENSRTNRVDGWLTHDIFLAKKINIKHAAANIKAELNNITNSFFDVVKYYPMPGRSFKISVIFNHI